MSWCEPEGVVVTEIELGLVWRGSILVIDWRRYGTYRSSVCHRHTHVNYEANVTNVLPLYEYEVT